jgi:hypothetical protein
MSAQKILKIRESAPTPSRGEKGGANRDAAIRAGKREVWAWQLHEITDLQRRINESTAQELTPRARRAVFLWAWDDVCLAHTKRRAISIDEAVDLPHLSPPSPGSVMLTSVPANTDDSIAGLKSTIRAVLYGIPKGLKLAQLESAFKDKTGEALDNDLATAYGFSDVEQLLGLMPDAVRRDGDRYVGMREATRHEITTLALVQNLNIRNDVVYLLDSNGSISEVSKQAMSAGQQQKEARPVTLPVSAYLPYDDSVVYEDLTEMQKIHLPSLLHNIEQRFLVEKIYTYIGNMLIAVNPYKALLMPVPGFPEACGLYDKDVRAYYASLKGDTRQKGVRAHVFVVADSAYRDLAAERMNQSVVISGESGAGKTKSAREVLLTLLAYWYKSANTDEAVAPQFTCLLVQKCKYCRFSDISSKCPPAPSRRELRPQPQAWALRSSW